MGTSNAGGVKFIIDLTVDTSNSQTGGGVRYSWGKPWVGKSYVILCEPEKEKAPATSSRVVVPTIEQALKHI